MANDATCIKSFGRDYFCGPMALAPAAGTPPPAKAVAPEVKAEEPKESCRYARNANEFIEVCTPRSDASTSTPTRSLWSAIGDAVMYILETNAKYAPKSGPRR